MQNCAQNELCGKGSSFVCRIRSRLPCAVAACSSACALHRHTTMHSLRTHCEHDGRPERDTRNSNGVSSAETSPATNRKREEKERKRFISKWNLHTITTFYANGNIIFHVCARLQRLSSSSAAPSTAAAAKNTTPSRGRKAKEVN